MAEGPAQDLYAILGCERGDDQATVSKKYKKQALKYHPDRNRAVNSATIKKLVVFCCVNLDLDGPWLSHFPYYRSLRIGRRAGEIAPNACSGKIVRQGLGPVSVACRIRTREGLNDSCGPWDSQT